jgi:putative ABC transport system substrate-binding protein
VGGGDLQAADMVTNLAKPEGNVTGVQNLEADLVGKRLALLKEVVPRLTQVGVLLWNRSYPTLVALVGAAENASRPLALQLQIVDGRLFNDLDGAFASLMKAHVRGLLVVNSPSIYRQRSHVLALATKTRLVTIYESRNWVDAGGLMSYGAVNAELQRRLAECVNKILRGAKPAEVPVQQPAKFELVINLKTAKALGLTIPPALLARADEVIQ